MAAPWVQIVGEDPLRQFGQEMRRAGRGGLVRQMQTEMRRAAQPALRDLKAAALALPAHGPKHTGLRAATARAVTLTNRTTGAAGARFSVPPGKMPPGKGMLPQHLDSRKGWRHPVYKREGKRNPWVRQHGRPWFWVTIRRHHPQFQAAMRRALERTLARIRT